MEKVNKDINLFPSLRPPKNSFAASIRKCFAPRENHVEKACSDSAGDKLEKHLSPPTSASVEAAPGNNVSSGDKEASEDKIFLVDKVPSAEVNICESPVIKNLMPSHNPLQNSGKSKEDALSPNIEVSRPPVNISSRGAYIQPLQKNNRTNRPRDYNAVASPGMFWEPTRTSHRLQQRYNEPHSIYKAMASTGKVRGNSNVSYRGQTQSYRPPSRRGGFHNYNLISNEKPKNQNTVSAHNPQQKGHNSFTLEKVNKLLAQAGLFVLNEPQPIFHQGAGINLYPSETVDIKMSNLHEELLEKCDLKVESTKNKINSSHHERCVEPNSEDLHAYIKSPKQNKLTLSDFIVDDANPQGVLQHKHNLKH